MSNPEFFCEFVKVDSISSKKRVATEAANLALLWSREGVQTSQDEGCKNHLGFILCQRTLKSIDLSGD